MADLYTKIVLTVIACALVVIAVRGPLANQAVAQGHGNECGNTSTRPCYVLLARPPVFLPGSADFTVEVVNWPKRY